MRLGILVLAVALIPLTGCIGGDADDQLSPAADDQLPGSAEVATFELGEPSEVAPKPNNQVEAAVSVSGDGRTVLTCFHGLFTETSPGYASTDGGETWEQLSFPDEAGPGGDCETAITPDGVWAFLASTVAGATILVTEDQGETWTVNHVTAIPTNGLADRPWLEAVGEELWLAYMPLYAQPGTIGFTKSTDYGESWTIPQHIGTPGPEQMSVRHGHFALGDEAVYLPMVRYQQAMTAGDRILQVAKTTDGGQTWSIEEIHRSPEVIDDWPSLAVTEQGDLLFLATVQLDGRAATHVLHKAPGGQWTDPVPVHEPENDGAYWPWIAGGNGRNATFIVSGGEKDGTEHVWIGRIDASDMTVETWPVDDEPAVEFASVDHDADGNAFAVWTDAEAQYFVKGTLNETRP